MDLNLTLSRKKSAQRQDNGDMDKNKTTVDKQNVLIQMSPWTANDNNMRQQKRSHFHTGTKWEWEN